MIAEKVFTALSPLFEARVFPGKAELDTPRPYATYRQVGGQAMSFIDKARPSKIHGRIQIMVFAESRDEATMLMYAVEDRLVADTTMQAEPIGAHVDRDDLELEYSGVQQDYSIWADRPPTIVFPG